jgi:hypothetical protein
VHPEASRLILACNRTADGPSIWPICSCVPSNERLALHAVPTLLAHLPNLGRGRRVARVRHQEGTFFHIVDVRPKKFAMNAALAPAHVLEHAEAAGVPAAGSSADRGAGEAAHAEADASGPAGGYAGAEQAEEAKQYIGPSGLVIKRRQFSAAVYGVRFKGGLPLTGRVNRLRHVYKREWRLVDEVEHGVSASAGLPGATQAAARQRSTT